MNDVVDVAVHDCGDATAGVVDAVVGDAVLRKVVSADFFGAVASANERFTRIRGGGHFFGLFLFEKTGTQDGHGFDAVLLLGAFVLHSNHDAGWQVCDADGRIGGIDALTAMTARTVDVDAEIFGVDFEVGFGSFRKHGDGDSRSVDAALRFSNWHTLDAMDATFEFKLTIGVVAGNFEDDFFHAAGFVLVFGHEFELQIVIFGVFLIHAIQFASKK